MAYLISVGDNKLKQRFVVHAPEESANFNIANARVRGELEGL